MRILLVLFCLAVTANAKVLVYKGTARTALPSTISQFSRLPHVYAIFDLVTKETNFIYYFTRDHKKDSVPFFPLDNTQYVAQAGSATKTIGTFSFVLDTSAGSDVGVNMFYLRGTVGSLQLSNGGLISFGDYPKTLTGIFREAQKIGSTASLFEFNFTLTFDAVHTQVANNLSESGSTTANDIEAELVQKGC